MPGKYSITKICEVLGAKNSISNNVTITHLLTDSRRLTDAPATLFFALPGSRDAHQFIPELFEAGVRSFVVKDDYQLPEALADATFIQVKNVLQALQQLAAFHRAQFNFPVIGITGSNGKTVVKEWLYQLLSPAKKVLRSPKSYNSQTGVPLSLWLLDKQYDLAIIEAGISLPGEMEKLEQMIRPDLGILTHFSSAHDEGFASREEKLMEKLKLFKHCKLLIYNTDQLAYNLRELLPEIKLFRLSRTDPQADFFISSQQTTLQDKTSFNAVFKGESLSAEVPFGDEASVENALLCWAAALALQADRQEISKKLSFLAPVSMRLEMKTGLHNCSVIDDSYNSDINSLEIALNFLSRQKQHPRKTLILSDIYQSGLPETELYKQVSQLISQYQIDHLIGVGPDISKNQALFKVHTKHFYPDTKTLAQHLSGLYLHNETILLKGSRNFAFEQISDLLVQKKHETVLEINLNALQHNFNYYKSILKPGVKLMAMVKAFSYGSGSFEIAGILQYNKADYLAVAYVDEGVALRNSGITLPILVLNPEASAFQELLDYHLEPEIYSFAMLQKFAVFIDQKSAEAFPIHLKIDTGMHRLGFDVQEVEAVAGLLQNNRQLQVKSAFSHLAASGSAQHDVFTKQQFAQFLQASDMLEQLIGYPFMRHIANTSAISRWPQMQLDMVRLGIGLYGIDTADDAEILPLQAVATLKTSISQIKAVKVGETVGYSRSEEMVRNGRIATVRIGYADGYLRIFGNGNGKMLINGQLAPTIGHVSMDMCMLDISGLEVNEDDEVIVFGETLSISILAKQAGTIPYEILTNISQRVKRVYFYE